MHSDQKVHPRNLVSPIYKPGSHDFNCNLPLGVPLIPFHSVEFQASENCPKDFVIFDKNNLKSTIMFHPSFHHKFNCPSFDIIHATYPTWHHILLQRSEVKTPNSSILKENSEEIDALMSSDDDEEREDEYSDEEVSTGRSPAVEQPAYIFNHSNNSKSFKSTAPSNRNVVSGRGKNRSTASSSDRKDLRIKKMIEALRGIIPNCDGTDSATILDEAVKYLQTLKVEAKKLGLQN